MEHRFGRREAVHLQVMVHFSALPPLVAVTRNVSRNGLNLSLTHPELAPMNIVNVAISDWNQEFCWQTRALVVHASERSGTGLVLAEDLPQWLIDAGDDQVHPEIRSTS